MWELLRAPRTDHTGLPHKPPKTTTGAGTFGHSPPGSDVTICFPTLAICNKLAIRGA